MKNALRVLAVCVAAAVTIPSVSAQSFQKPEDAIKYRKAAFTVLAAHFGPLGAMANNRIPYNAQQAAEHGAILEVVARTPWAGFGAGTNQGDTRAKPEIWTEQAKFKDAGDKMQAEMMKLAAAAKSGSVEQLRAAFGPTAATCKACHDNYRRD